MSLHFLWGISEKSAAGSTYHYCINSQYYLDCKLERLDAVLPLSLLGNIIIAKLMFLWFMSPLYYTVNVFSFWIYLRYFILFLLCNHIRRYYFCWIWATESKVGRAWYVIALKEFSHNRHLSPMHRTDDKCPWWENTFNMTSLNR